MSGAMRGTYVLTQSGLGCEGKGVIHRIRDVVVTELTRSLRISEVRVGGELLSASHSRFVGDFWVVQRRLCWKCVR